jgi:glycosyltransferase involved in cell wall biosynthesis
VYPSLVCVLMPQNNILFLILRYFKRINAGGLIELNHGNPQPLQYAMKFAYLANLYADYLDAVNVPGWYCGPNYFSVSNMRSFAKSQVQFYPFRLHKCIYHSLHQYKTVIRPNKPYFVYFLMNRLTMY